MAATRFLVAAAFLAIGGAFAQIPQRPMLKSKVICGESADEWGMTTVHDPACSTCTEPGCTIGCFGEDAPDCSWCVYDEEKCVDKWDKVYNNSMCKDYITYSTMRGYNKCKGTGMPYKTYDNYCLAPGHDVPGLRNGWMTLEVASARCANVRNETGYNPCAGYWYRALTREEAPVMEKAPDNNCPRDFPIWGMTSMMDPSCATCWKKPDSCVGCIGESGCSWCVYDLKTCEKEWDHVYNNTMCETYVRTAKERGAKDCSGGPKSDEVYVRFSTEFKLVNAVDCTSEGVLKGVSDPALAQGPPRANWKVYNLFPEQWLFGTSITDGVMQDPKQGRMFLLTGEASPKCAAERCYDHDSECEGWRYTDSGSAYNQGTPALVQFMKKGTTLLGNASYSSYQRGETPIPPPPPASFSQPSFVV
mmetsp:Transcript_4924/g.9478  ORF Transcript_4924/g.9478 Transcript_4924/m.9478 type:complete len:418 (-) Transcript_4924:301-1554(-)